MKHLIILPYYNEDEIEKYIQMAPLFERFKQKVDYEFLLVARYDCDESQELLDRFSKIKPTKSIQCTTVGNGIVKASKGFEVEGPTAMFWDAMKHIYENYPKDGGFALWFESDMFPMKEDWLDQLDEEWNKEYMLMGHLHVGRKISPRTETHINGGACYSKNLLKHTNRGEYNLKNGWDMSLYKKLQNKKLLCQGTNKIQLFYGSKTFDDVKDLISEEAVVLHGPKDYSVIDHLKAKFKVK